MDESFGKYHLTQLIGTGGMAEVFLAVERTPHSERHVVVKRILPSYATDPDFIEFFLHEARIALQLNHPNIVQTYELGEEKGTYYLAMEYVRGETALSLIRQASQRGEQLSIDAVAKIAADVAAALDHVHAARDVNGTPLEIVHRDVSPHNIVVSSGGVAKLVDFGIARAACQEFRTRTGVVKGKFAYLAPEQLQRGGRFDHRADLFSLGIVLFELLTRRPLFRGATDADTMNRVLSGRIPPVRELRRETPPAFAAVVEKALERDPERRYASAGALLADLDEATRLSGLFPSVTRLRDEVERLFEEEDPPTIANQQAPRAAAPPTRLPGPPVARTTKLPVGPAVPNQQQQLVPAEARASSRSPVRAVGAQALAAPLPPPRPVATPPPARAAAPGSRAEASPFPAPLPPSPARGASDGWVPERDIMLEHFLRVAGARRPGPDRALTTPLRAPAVVVPDPTPPPAPPLLALPLPAPDDTPAVHRPPALVINEVDGVEIEADEEPTLCGPGLEDVVLELPGPETSSPFQPAPAVAQASEITGTTAPESLPRLKARRRRRLLAVAALALTAVSAALLASLLNLL